MIQDKLEPDFDLGTEVSRNWEEITNQWYQFDRQQKDVEIIKAITKEEMGDWLRKFTLPGKDHRKLTIQVSHIEHSMDIIHQMDLLLLKQSEVGTQVGRLHLLCLTTMVL